MVKKERYISLGLDTDTAPDKCKPDTYWDAENIQIVNNGRGLSIKPILGETNLNVTFPAIVYGNSYEVLTPRTVLGYTVFMESIYVITYRSELELSGGPGVVHQTNEILKINSSNTVTTIASGDWNIFDTYKVECVVNYETDALIKLYWIDGYNPLRFINIAKTHGTIGTGFNIVNEVDLITPTVVLSGNGNLTAGCIQYVYNYYNNQGGQSTLSPASKLLSINNFFQGFNSQDNTGIKAEVTIPSIDTDYNFLKIYSIHYLELNQTPIVKLIYEETTSSGSLTIYDDGTRYIAESTPAELLEITPLPYIPNTLAIKRDRLFIANYDINNFNPDIDMRAYSYPYSSTGPTYLTHNGASVSYTKAQLDVLSKTHDAINSNYNTYYCKYNSASAGGTGVNIEYSFDASIADTDLVPGYIPPKSLKKFEIYRIGVKLYNNLGQASPVKWIADFRVPDGLSGNLAHIIGLKVKLTHAGYLAFVAAGVTNYQVCIVERKPEDRTIISQGFIVPSVRYYQNGTGDGSYPLGYLDSYHRPYYITKDIVNPTYATAHSVGGGIWTSFINNVDFQYTATYPYPIQDNSIVFFYSSDTIFETDTITPTKIRTLGSANVWGTEDNAGKLVIRLYRNGNMEHEAPYNHYNTGWPDIDPVNHEMLLHVMDSGDISTGTTDIFNFEIVMNKTYLYHTHNARSTTTDVISLEAEGNKFLKSGEIKYIDAGATANNGCNLYGLVNNGTSLPTYYSTKYANSIILNFDTSTWHQVTNPFDKFDTYLNAYSNTVNFSRSLPMVELLRDVPNQYGGNSYESKQRNEYLDLGTLHATSETEFVEYIGDIWVGPLSVCRASGENVQVQAQMNLYEYINLPYIENNHNVYARSDNMYAWKTTDLNLTTDYNFFSLADNHKLFSAYNQVPNLFKSYPEPFNFNAVSSYPVSVLGSNSKTPNESIDSWLTFLPNNTRMLEGQYGPISKLYNLGGDLLSLQSTGICQLEIEPRIQTQSDDGVGIQLGIGSLFYNYKYITTNTGTNKKFTVCDNGKNLFYYDDTLNTICSIFDGKLSTLKTVKYILDANPTGPVSATFFNYKDQVYFHYTTFTLVYDLLLQKFVAKYTFLNSNKWVIPRQDDLYQIDDTTSTTKLYTQLTGTAKASKIIYTMAPESNFEKVFHNLEYRLIGSNFTNVRVLDQPTTSLSRNNSGLVAPEIATKFDIHRMHLPRIANTRERFRGTYVYIELLNTGDFSLDDLVLMYNIKG